MKQQFKGPQPTPGQVPPSQAEDPDKPREKSEAEEVAGRHQNSGQKDHEGAR